MASARVGGLRLGFAPNTSRSACDTRGVITHFLVFVGVSAIVIVLPGRDTVVVTKNLLLHGRRTALASSFGVGGGLSVWTLAAAVGIASLLKASAVAFTVLKLGGAAYLIWIGVQAFRTAGHQIDGAPVAGGVSARRHPAPGGLAGFLLRARRALDRHDHATERTRGDGPHHRHRPDRPRAPTRHRAPIVAISTVRSAPVEVGSTARSPMPTSPEQSLTQCCREHECDRGCDDCLPGAPEGRITVRVALKAVRCRPTNELRAVNRWWLRLVVGWCSCGSACGSSSRSVAGPSSSWAVGVAAHSPRGIRSMALNGTPRES